MTRDVKIYRETKTEVLISWGPNFLLHREKIKMQHTIETKWGIVICCQAKIFTVFTHREGKVTNF